MPLALKILIVSVANRQTACIKQPIRFLTGTDYKGVAMNTIKAELVGGPHDGDTFEINLEYPRPYRRGGNYPGEPVYLERQSLTQSADIPVKYDFWGYQ